MEIPFMCHQQEKYQIGISAIHSLADLHQLKFIKEALSDIESAVNHATSKIPQYGQSKWSSLCATEKTIKAYIEVKKGPIKKHHRLADLLKIAEESGLPEVDKNLIESIQCTGNIKYGEEECNLLNAHKAHISSLKLIYPIAIKLTELKFSMKV